MITTNHIHNNPNEQVRTKEERIKKVKNEVAQRLANKDWAELMHDYEYAMGISSMYSMDELGDKVAYDFADQQCAERDERIKELEKELKSYREINEENISIVSYKGKST